MGLFPMLIFSVRSESDSLKQYHLHPVRVIAEGPQASIGSISSIQKPKNSDSISEAIKLSPGLNISYGSRDESNLKIRGFRKNENLIMIDGRPLNSGYFGNVDLSKILIDDIAEIRIVKGPASAMYGTSTMGGVVNLISSKDAYRLALESKLSRNLVNSQRISSAQRLGDFRYKFSIMRDERRPYPLSEDFEPTVFENGKLRDHNYQSSWQMDAIGDWLVNDLHEMSVNLGYTTIPYKEIPSSIYIWDYGTYKDWYRANASLGMDFFSSLSSNVRGQVYFDAAGDTFERFRDASHQIPELSSRMESFNIGLAPVYEHRARGVWNTGSRMEYRKVKRKDDNNYREWTHNHALVGSVFSQYEADINAALSYTLSLGIAFFGHSKSEQVRFHPEPSAAIIWNHQDNVSTMLSLGINSSIPTMRQLFSAENGNPDLKASSARKVELSHKRNLGSRVMLDTSVYFNDVRNLIDRTNNRYENIYKHQSYGGEISLNCNIAEIWDATLQYSLLQNRGDYKLSDSAPHSMELLNRIQLPWDFVLHCNSEYRSKRDSQDSIEQFHSLPAYFAHEIGIQKKWRNFEIQFALQNILDENYQTEYGFPAPGRDFSLRLKYILR